MSEPNATTSDIVVVSPETLTNNASTDESGTTDSTEATVAFNPSVVETRFGLPTGYLKDAKTEEDAYTAIQKFADEALQASLDETFVEDDDEDEPLVVTDKTPTVPVAETTAAKLAAATKGESSAIDDLRKELAAIKAGLAASQSAQAKLVETQVTSRLDSTIDSWASPKYGVSGNRTYKQAKAVKEFKSELFKMASGLAKSGKPVPVIEQAALQYRAYDDPDGFRASLAKSTVTATSDQVPLGTPGQPNAKSGDAKSPTNIHSAIYQGGKFVNLDSARRS